jgi:hypothetical protein
LSNPNPKPDDDKNTAKALFFPFPWIPFFSATNWRVLQ